MIANLTDIQAGPWPRIVVGVLTRVAPHPAADREVITEVDVGWGIFTVVTGGPGIAIGRKVALALPGARVFDPYAPMPRLLKLKRRRIRGVLSEGMLCSARELGIGDDHSAVYLLDTEAPIGFPIAMALKSDGTAESHCVVDSTKESPRGCRDSASCGFPAEGRWLESSLEFQFPKTRHDLSDVTLTGYQFLDGHPQSVE